MRNVKKTIAIVLIVVLVGIAVAGGLIHGAMYLLANDAVNAEVYETNDIADYGIITGNCDNDPPKEFIASFFPGEIKESFSDVTYHYKAKNFDTYAYEAYLEFVIEDAEAFAAYLADHANTATTFAYDESYMACEIARTLDLSRPAKANGAYAIDNAKVGYILYNTEEQRIIYFALGVFDGGGTDTSELNYFFDRFDIEFND